MAVTAVRLRYSYRDYARFEERAREKHEFFGGLILAMAGGTLEHGALSAAIVAALVSQLGERRCRVFDSNARVRVAATGNAYYPDASVVCGRLEVDPEDERSMTNPVVLVEVLSPSTEEYDRSDKLADYCRIASLRHIVHVAHDEQRIDVWARSGEQWLLRSHGPGTVADLTDIGCRLDVSQIYRDPLADPDQ